MFNKKLIVALLTVAVLFLGVYSFAQGGNNDDDQNEETQNEDDNDEEQVSGENEIPLIKITGSNDITINVGRTYTDAGATATDEEDGDLTDDIVINNNVNTLVVGNYTVTYDVEDSNKNKAVQAIRTVHVVDRTKPTISLLGETTVDIEVGNAYTDAGAKANDNYNGNITDHIVVVNPVNTNAVGTYTITYNAKDDAGNEANEVTRTVNVVDTTAPVITLNGNKTLTIELGSTYLDEGAKALDNYDKDITSKIVVTSTVNPSKVGNYTVTYTVDDNAGNSATAVVRSVRVADTKAPTVTFGTNGNASYAKSASTLVTVEDNGVIDIATLKYKWTKSTTEPTDTDFEGGNFTSGDVINTTNKMSGIYYLWVLAKDEHGNTTKAMSEAFYIDNIKPVITGVKANTNYNHSVTPIVSEDNLESLKLLIESTSETIDFTSGTEITREGRYVLTAKDKAGNETVINFYLDYTNPTIKNGNVDLTSGSSLKDDVNLVIFDRKLTQIKVNAQLFKVDKDKKYFTISNNQYSSDVTFKYTLTEEGNYTVTATDLSGNNTTTTFTIDKTAPEITIGDYTKDPTNKDITVTATTNEGTLNVSSHIFNENGSFDFIATDAAGNVTTKTVTISSIDKVAPEITIEDYTKDLTNKDIIVTATTNEGTLNAGSHTFTENGSFDFIATDAAGNVTTKTVTIGNIDKIAPVFDLVSGYHTTGNITINVTELNLKSINVNNQDLKTNVLVNNGAVLTDEGTYKLTATDLAGNKAEIWVAIDRTAPTIDGVVNNGFYKDSVTVTVFDKFLTLVKNGDMVYQYPSSIHIVGPGTENRDKTLTLSDEGTYTIVGTDKVGNSTTTTFTIDKTAPVITIGDYTKDPTNKDITVTATTNEGTLNVSSHIFTENGSFDFIATDAAGNVTTKTVTISNIDKTAPIANQRIFRTTTQKVNGVYAKLGSTVYLKLSFNEPLGTWPTVTIAGVTINNYKTTTDTAGNVYYAYYLDLNASVAATLVQNGKIPFRVSGYTDLAGNPGAEYTTVSNSDYIIFDSIKPELTIKSESIGTDPYFSNVSFKLHDDNLKELEINGVVKDESAGPWGDHNFVTVNNMGGKAGNNIIKLRDKAGNETTYEFNLDVTAPTLNVTGNPTTWTNQDVTLTVNATDNSTKLADLPYSFDGGLTWQSENTKVFGSNQDVNVIVKDKAGNTTSTIVNITKIDKATPTATVSYSPEDLTNNKVKATIKFSEPVKDTLTPVLGSYTGGGRFIKVSDTEYYIEYWININFEFTFEDLAGNIGTERITVTNIDKTAPTFDVTGNATSWTNQDVTLTINNVSDNSNLLAAKPYSFDGGVTWQSENQKTFTSNQDVVIMVKDSANNTSSKTINITKIDKTAPSLSVEDPNQSSTPNKGYTRKVTASDSQSGINASSLKYLWSTTRDASLPSVATTGTNIASGENAVSPVGVTGTYYLLITVSDEAGNTETYMSWAFNIDNTAPVITIDPYITTPTNQDITVTASTNEGTLNTTTNIFTSNGSFTFTATDAVGNVSNKTVTINNIDKEAPTATVLYSTTSPTNADVTAFLAPSEPITVTNNGGLSSYTFASNDSFTFEFIDAAGNVGSATATVGNIDKVDPIITVNPYTTSLTNQDVVVTVSTNEGTLNAASHTFTSNESFTFTATDAAGNVSSRTVTITNIDKEKPEIWINGSNPLTLGYADVTYSRKGGASARDNGIDISSRITYTGTVNVWQKGTYYVTYSVTDDAGNTSTAIRTVIVKGLF